MAVMRAARRAAARARAAGRCDAVVVDSVA